MRTSSKLVVTLALVSFAFMAFISSSAFADVDITTEGKVSGKPFEYLQQQIDNIQLIPGPAGAQGPAGADGVCYCSITQEQLDNLIARIEYLESLLLRLLRFTDMGDGTIRDNETGLIWLKNASCIELPYTDSDGKANWEDAKSAAAELASGICGLADGSVPGDWRLPTKEEWKAFYSTVYNAPTLVNTVGDAQWSEGDAFTEVQSSNYWSSTEYDSTRAWVVGMGYGNRNTNDKDVGFYVWPVRSDN